MLPKATLRKSSMLELNKTSTMEHYNTAVIPYSIFCRLLNNLKRKQMFMKTFQILSVDLLMIYSHLSLLLATNAFCASL